MIPKQEAELLVEVITKLAKIIVPVEAALEAMYAVEEYRHDQTHKYNHSSVVLEAAE